MSKIKVGVLGAGRGMTMITQLLGSKDAELVAVCDFYTPLLERVRKLADKHGVNVTLYEKFDDFINHPELDAVVLANYATEHAPFAIRLMKKGIHVMSEVLPVQTMREAVELIETVEETGMVYAYAENYCYMPAPREMRRLYRAGKIGSFEYGEGEYMHNCEPIWHDISWANPNHWRNTMYASFYCTHSIGPLIHITGLRPVKVSAFEMPFNERMARMGAKAGGAAIEIITLENGAILKSLHGVGPSRNSVWYSIYGSEGRLESAREDAEVGGVSRIYTNLTERNPNYLPREYEPKDEFSKIAYGTGHGGSDFYTTYNFIRKIMGDPDAETVDVYEAMDMFLPGILGYQSILKGGEPQSIPDLRDKAQREIWRNNTACTDPNLAGDMLIPSYSKGNPDIPDSTYAAVREKREMLLDSKRQLEMIMFPKKKDAPVLPEGYAITNFDGSDAAIDAWLEICKNGLIANDSTRRVFYDCIVRENIKPREDCFFIEHNGEKVATITAINNYHGGMGYIHMVSVREDYRGKGLGNILTRIAENKFAEANVKMAYLTTDDFRKAACRSYLSAGMYPVNCDDDMEKRWTDLITEFGINSVMMLKENGEPDRIITAR